MGSIKPGPRRLAGMVSLVVLASVGFLAYGCWRSLQPLSKRARAPLLATLYAFLTKPVLEAMELMYWPLLFEFDVMEVVPWSIAKQLDVVPRQVVGGRRGPRPDPGHPPAAR